MARLGWSLPLPGPFRVSGDFRTRPSTAGRDLARQLEASRVAREGQAAQDAERRNELADMAARVLPHATPEQHAAAEAAILRLAAAPLGSMRSRWRAGAVVYALNAVEHARR